MSHEQYMELKTLYPRTALYPLEVQKLLNLFEAIEGFSAGCNTCPDTVHFATDRLYPKVAAYEANLNKQNETN